MMTELREALGDDPTWAFTSGRPRRVQMSDLKGRRELWDALEQQVTEWTGNDARVLSHTRTELTGRTDPAFDNIETDGLVLYGDPKFLRKARKSIK
jgi:hypothetical protein